MRSKKAFYNLSSGLALQIITALIGIILPKLFIDVYGSDINGLVSSIKQFLSYLTIVGAGVGAASIAALYSPIANENIIKINGILSATKNFYKRSGYLFSLLVFLLALIYPNIVKEEVGIYFSFLMVLIIGISGIVEFLVIGKYQVLLSADQKSYIVNGVQIAGIILNALVSILMIKGGFNVLTVQVTSTLVYISRIFILIRYVNRKYSTINYNCDPDFKAINNRWDALVHQVAGLVVFNTPFVIITIFCGLKEVSVFAIYFMVISGVVMLVSAFSNGLMAAFGDILAKDERNTLLSTFNQFESMYYLIMTWTYTCTALLIIPFVKVYTTNVHDVEYVRYTVAILFIIVGISNSIRVPPLTIVNAAGHYSQTKYRSIFEALINIVVSLLVVQSWGIEGVLFGSICSYAYRTIDLIVYSSRKIIKRPVRYTFYKLSYNFGLAAISILPFFQFIKINVENFIDWTAWAFIVGLWSLIVLFIGNFLIDPATLKSILLRFKKLLPHAKNMQKAN